MLDKTKEKILKKKGFKIQTFEPYNKLAIKFLNEFSIELRKNKKFINYLNLIYLMYWCNNKTKLIKKKKDNLISLGRGLAFHVCPSNVPTNFIYSFIFGILSGNSNIVKIPQKILMRKNNFGSY